MAINLLALAFAGLVVLACAPVGPVPPAQSPGARASVPHPRSYAPVDWERLLRRHGFSGAALVAHRDDVLYRGAMGTANVADGLENTPETRFKAASLHKQMDAALILSLAADGLLRIDRSLCQGITDCPASLEDVTYHQVLTHTSGIGELSEEDGARIDSNTTALRVIGDADRLFEPGDGWAYSSTAYSLFTATPELITGRPLAELLDERVYGPAGLIDTGLDGFDGPPPGSAVGHVEPDGQAVPDPVGTWTTVDDLHRWHRSLLEGSVLPPEMIELMETPHVEIEPRVSYGYGVEVRTVHGHREVAHRGGTPGFSGYLIRYPDDDAVIVLLSNAESTDVDALRDAMGAQLFRATG